MSVKDELLENIKNKRAIDEAMIPGHIDTPKLPDAVFDIEYNKDGTEFKRSINPNRFYVYLKNVNINTLDPKSAIENKVIKESQFFRNCQNALSDIMKHSEFIRGTKYSGFRWLESGNCYSVSLQSRQINEYIKALSDLVNSAIKPINNVYSNEENPERETYQDIISGYSK